MAGGSGVTLGFLKFVLGLDGLAFEQGLGLAEKQLKATQKKLAKMGERMSDVGQRLSLAVTLPVAAFGTASVKAASDAAELQSAFNVTFGKMSSEMNKWAEATGNALGRSTQEMQKAANTFGLFFNTAAPPDKAAAMSKTFAKLAQDLSSFFNVDTQTAIDKLRSGLSGESEPLRDFGVFLTEASVQAKALELGLTGVGNELTEQEKILARYHLILGATTKAQGDVERTSGSFANQLRRSQAAFEELQVTIGTKLIPAITPLLVKLGDALTWFSKLPQPVQDTALAVVALSAALGPTMMAVGTMSTTLSNLLPVLARMGGTAGLLGLGPALGIVAAGALAVYAAYQNWDKIGPWIDGVVTRTKGAAAEIDAKLRGIQAAADDFDRRMGIPGKSDLFDAIGAKATEAWNKIDGFLRGIQAFADGFDAAAVRAWKSFEVMHARVQAAFNRMVNGIGDAVRSKLNGIMQSVIDKARAVGDAFYTLWDRVVGHSYIPDMVEGIGHHIGRLDTLMVAPVGKMTGAAAQSFQQLQGRVQATLDRLFPDEAQVRDLTAQIDAIDQAMASNLIKPEVWGRARDRLRAELQGALRAAEAANDNGIAGPTVNIPASVLDVPGFEAALESLQVEVSDALGGAAEASRAAWADMAQAATDGVRNIVGAIRGGGFLDVVSSVLDVFTQLAGMGAFGKGMQGRVQANAPQFGGFRATGGPVVPGKSYVVGERGPEWFTPRARGFVTPGDAPSGRAVSFDLRGAVMTQDLVMQMQTIASQTSGQAIGAYDAGRRRLARRTVG